METPMFDQWRSRSPHYDESHEAVCDTVRAFVAREITPNVDAWEAAGELPRELHRKAAEAGILGLNYPEEFGGTGTAFDLFHSSSRPRSWPGPARAGSVLR
jgi:acyl-CoA dehydrogenase